MTGSTHYGSLTLGAPKQEKQTAKKAAFILAHVLLVAAVFYGGRASYGAGTVNFTHEEVLDAVVSCKVQTKVKGKVVFKDSGKFVGGCQNCKTCKSNEYPAGGCSYFKDTLCVLCEEIRHCPQEKIRCTTKNDSICIECTNGYWDDDCKPCTVCELIDGGVDAKGNKLGGFYEKTACTQKSDTVCARARQCKGPAKGKEYYLNPGEWMNKQLEYFKDRDCKACTKCQTGKTFTAAKCKMGDNIKNIEGKDTVCKTCSKCKVDEYVKDKREGISGICTTEKDTTCTKCDRCPKGKYITDLCIQGTIHKEGKNTVCADCTARKIKGKNGYTGPSEWELFPCGGTSDALYRTCTKCMPGEYQKMKCTPTSDTLCPDCTPLNHCKKGKVTCTNNKDSTCHECKEGFSGSRCCYQKTFGDCGTDTTRERAAFRYGFDYKKAKSNQAFIDFCRGLCDEFPDCLAFEVEDGGKDFKKSGPTNMLTRDAKCFFKAAYTNKPKKPQFDCYSHICRQMIPKGLPRKFFQ